MVGCPFAENSNFALMIEVPFRFFKNVGSKRRGLGCGTPNKLIDKLDLDTGDSFPYNAPPNMQKAEPVSMAKKGRSISTPNVTHTIAHTDLIYNPVDSHVHRDVRSKLFRIVTVTILSCPLMASPPLCYSTRDTETDRAVQHEHGTRQHFVPVQIITF